MKNPENKRDAQWPRTPLAKENFLRSNFKNPENKLHGRHSCGNFKTRVLYCHDNLELTTEENNPIQSSRTVKGALLLL